MGPCANLRLAARVQHRSQESEATFVGVEVLCVEDGHDGHRTRGPQGTRKWNANATVELKARIAAISSETLPNFTIYLHSQSPQVFAVRRRTCTVVTARGRLRSASISNLQVAAVRIKEGVGAEDRRKPRPQIEAPARFPVTPRSAKRQTP